MKIVVLLLSVAALAHYSQGLSCFTCINAGSNEECNEKGKIVECRPNEQSCQNEVRLNAGNRYRITKRCKQARACTNNQDQNDKPAWDPTQCNPIFTVNSVCRCCCDENLCNEAAMPCDDEPKCSAPVAPTAGRVDCDKMNFPGSTCKYACNSGYELIGRSSIECIETNATVGWESNAPSCQKMTCDASTTSSPANGKVSCSNKNSINSHCTFTCKVGYTMVGSGISKCNSNRRWSENAPTCIRTTCELSFIDFLLDGGVECTNDNFYGSACYYQCEKGFNLVGSDNVLCQANGQFSSAKPVCEKVTCDSIATIDLINGETTCTDNNVYESACLFDCDTGFYLAGMPAITCKDDGQWSTETPECLQITCDKSEVSITNGQNNCDNENIYGSICTFQCDEGYQLIGETESVCMDGFWTVESPICQQKTCGPSQTGPSNGGVVCSDGNRSFSECSYICGDGGEEWEYYGANSTSCLEDPFSGEFEWTQDPPCCARKCPPYAQVDLFLVLDSSSSVGRENWNKTVHFIKSVIDNFVVSQNDMLVAAVRYNKFVDSKSEIKIGQYTDNFSTTNAIINLPYDGSGTLTGQALTYVLESMLTAPGNRPEVHDLVLVVTDGISKDDVVVPARNLRNTGTNVVALGVVNQKGSLKEEDIIDIAADPEKTVLLDTGFEGLSQDLIDVILKQVCGNPCDRQNQYSGLPFSE